MSTTAVQHSGRGPDRPDPHRAAAPGTAVERRTSRGDRAFRPDIQGLRAVAVLLVVLYHCAVPGIRGGFVGVDVFFVLSGFLITRHLVEERARTGAVSLTGFYARRIKRLLPSALVVVTVTVLLTRFWGPPLQAVPVARDALFSTFYLMNYRLAALGVDYQHAGGPVSPLQHFWSLAVEEQFYLLWPVLILVIASAARRRWPQAVVALTGAVLAGSLVMSVLLTGSNAPLAYFALQTRAWELGAGALVAVGVPWLVRLLSSPIGVRCTGVAGWAGLLLIAGSGVLFTGATPFPGIAAVVPVIGAAMVLIAGLARPHSAEGVLAAPVPTFLGRVSYGWYLWHWPLLVLAPSVLGTSLDWPANLLVAGLALLLAEATNVGLEQVAARSTRGRRHWFAVGAALSGAVTAVAALVIALPSARLADSGPAPALDLAAVDSAQLTGLLQQAYDAPSLPSNLRPSLSSAVDDVPPTTADGCNVPFLTVTNPPCVFGDPAGARTVVLFGDSHAEQWFGALQQIATTHGWRLISWTKAACPMADVLLFSDQLHRPFTECPAWRKGTLARIAELHPDLVIASGSDALPGPSFVDADWAARTVTTATALQHAATRVVYLGDVPAPTTNVPVCLADNVRAPQRCQFAVQQNGQVTAADQFPGRRAAVTAGLQRIGVPVVDPTAWLCGTSGCPVVLGDTLIYRDATHLTQYYSRALAGPLTTALAATVPWVKS